MKSRFNINNCITETIENIRTDRDKASLLLTDIIILLKQDPQRNKEIGMVAAKYLETLQRSNEQMVKLISIHKKEETNNSETLSEDDKEDLFDILQDEQNNENNK